MPMKVGFPASETRGGPRKSIEGDQSVKPTNSSDLRLDSPPPLGLTESSPLWATRNMRVSSCADSSGKPVMVENLKLRILLEGVLKPLITQENWCLQLP